MRAAMLNFQRAWTRGLARMALLVALLAVALPPATTLAANGWQAEYYANEYLQGTPVLVRHDPAVNFYWGNGSPAPQVPHNSFSARWTRQLSFSTGRYRFYTRTDDGVRLYVDGFLLIDKWHPMPPTTYSGEINLTAGTHTIRMEYFEHTGMASAKLWWKRIGPVTPPAEAWRGEYFANPSLSGSPAFVRQDESVNFDWRDSSPDPRLPADGFSVRWSKDVEMEANRYTFFVRADDGVRLYIDGNLVIDDWRDGLRTRETTIKLAAGHHSLRLEYYEHTGQALVHLWWERKPEKTRLVGNLITCMRPRDSWIKVYRKMPDGSWQDINPFGWGPIAPSGFIKIDGLPVEWHYGRGGQQYRVELWAEGSLIRSVGDIDHGQAEFRIYPWTDNYTPWGCPAP